MAGRKYHDADLVWDHLRIGMLLRLEREPDNHYDHNAIQVIATCDCEDYLLGYIPRTDNQSLATLFDAGWGDIFDCRISMLNPRSAPRKSGATYHKDKKKREKKTGLTPPYPN